MCGFSGAIIPKNIVSKNNLKSMLINSLKKISFRGPDDTKIIIDEKDGFYVCFGFNRLSIIDLSNTSMQPIINKNKTTVFNGEIYNFNEMNQENYLSDTIFLKKNLENKNILSLLNEIKGMFSIVSFDKLANELSFGTDYFGQKPLYYYHKSNFIFFSSQISSLVEFKFIEKELNTNSIKNYLDFNFIFGKETIFNNIYYQEPNTLVTFKIFNGKINKVNKCKIKKINNKKIIKSKNNLIKDLDNNFNNTIKLHINTDVKTCSLLSSGIDSSLVSIYASKMNTSHETFTMKFKEHSISESKEIDSFVKKTKIKNLIIEPEKNDIFDFLENINNIYDQPFSDSSQINQHIIFKKIKQSGYKCTLSGDGGDEIFGGYNRYNSYSLIRFLNKFNLITKPLQFLIKKLILKNNINSIDKLHKFLMVLSSKNSKEYYLTLINNQYKFRDIDFNFDTEINNDKEDIINFDKLFYLPYDILTKIDRSSMYNSIENRSPFIYEDIYNYVSSTNILKISKNKSILHELMYKKFKIKIPRRKKGFAFSIENLLLRNKSFEDYIKDILQYGNDNYYELLGGESYKRIVNRFHEGVNIYNFIIWNRVVLILWLKKYY